MKYMHMSWIVAALLAVAVGTGCHNHEDSATLKEARALNEETAEVGRQFNTRLDLIREDLEAQLASPDGAGDLADSFQRALAKLADLDARYETWMSNQVLLPGATCNHDHADGEHHHHRHETSLDDLSDDDHLALQKAIRAELDGLVNELNSLTP
jgi:DNA-binding GntR family transcriptional regulator